ncbi:MAG: universal stress protein [Bacteroidetes bacterium]|jgi:nucleotide-binding universal stress UspA family protein|nr:universal stress protein [Bacteroidota bacterium]
MKLLQNILVPVDFSESSLKAVETAIFLAKAFQSQVILLHVIENDIHINSKTIQTLEHFTKNNLEELENNIKFQGITHVRTIIEKGVAFEVIISFAQRENINVIVAGAGSDSKENAYKLGTTAEKLMRKNQIPLWIVKDDDVKPIQKILCPLDFSDASKRALSNAITLSQRLNAELTILNVYKPVHYFSSRLQVDNNEENNSLRAEQEKELYDFLKSYQLQTIKHDVELVDGEPFLEILKKIKQDNFDLLLMGTTGKTGLSRLLMGSVTEKVTRELPCNFVTTKSIDITDDYIASNIKGMESIINTAKELLNQGEYDQAIEKFSMALKQYPDNIPVLLGLIKAHKIRGNNQKAKYFRSYARDIIQRIWGEEYLSKIDLD